MKTDRYDTRLVAILAWLCLVSGALAIGVETVRWQVFHALSQSGVVREYVIDLGLFASGVWVLLRRRSRAD